MIRLGFNRELQEALGIAIIPRYPYSCIGTPRAAGYCMAIKVNNNNIIIDEQPHEPMGPMALY